MLSDVHRPKRPLPIWLFLLHLHIFEIFYNKKFKTETAPEPGPFRKACFVPGGWLRGTEQVCWAHGRPGGRGSGVLAP